MLETYLKKYPVLKSEVCLRGHNTDQFDTGLNFVIHFAVSPFKYKYLDLDTYELLLMFTGESSLDDLLDEYDEESQQVIFESITVGGLGDYVEFSDKPVFISDDEKKIRFKQVNQNSSLPLNSVHFHISNRCNFKCKHCYHSSYDVSSKKIIDLTLIEVEEIFKDLSDNNVNFIYFSGGEPLLNKDFISYLKILRRYKIPYGFISNFSLMTEDLLKEIKEIGGCREINTSLDGPTREIHDSFRKAPGSFDHIMNLLPSALKMGITVNLNTSIHPGWADKISLWEEVLKSTGVENWRLEYSAPSGNFNINKADLEIKPNKLMSIYDQVYSLIKKSELDSQLKYYMIGRHIRKSDNFIKYSKDDPICMPHIDLLFLEATGDMPYCSLFPEQFPVYGNVRNDRLIDVWNRICDFRLKNRLSKLKCGTCSFIEKCGGGCPGTWEEPQKLIGCDLENKAIFNSMTRL